MLLASSDDELIDAVGEILRPMDHLGLRIVATADEAAEVATRDGAAMVLVHLDAEGQADRVVRLLGRVAAAQRPIPTLVLSDQHHAEEALRLLRAGVADYLSQPFDWGRLAYL